MEDLPIGSEIVLKLVETEKELDEETVRLILENSLKFKTKEETIAFQEYLVHHGLLCTIRDSKGIDISAACGQIKEKVEGEIS